MQVPPDNAITTFTFRQGNWQADARSEAARQAATSHSYFQQAGPVPMVDNDSMDDDDDDAMDDDDD